MILILTDFLHENKEYIENKVYCLYKVKEFFTRGLTEKFLVRLPHFLPALFLWKSDSLPKNLQKTSNDPTLSSKIYHFWVKLERFKMRLSSNLFFLIVLRCVHPIIREYWLPEYSARLHGWFYQANCVSSVFFPKANDQIQVIASWTFTSELIWSSQICWFLVLM